MAVEGRVEGRLPGALPPRWDSEGRRSRGSPALAHGLPHVIAASRNIVPPGVVPKASGASRSHQSVAKGEAKYAKASPWPGVGEEGLPGRAQERHNPSPQVVSGHEP